MADKKRHAYSPALTVHEIHFEHSTLTTIKVLANGRNLLISSKLRDGDRKLLCVKMLLLHGLMRIWPAFK